MGEFGDNADGAQSASNPPQDTRVRRPRKKPQARRAVLRINSLGGFGDGMAVDPAGQVAVPFTAPGDLAEVDISPAAGGRLAGELVTLNEPGPVRTEPACRHFGRCGGCRMQHIQPDAYADWKDGLWRAALARAGIGADKLAGVEVRPMHIVQPGSRRRARLAVRGKTFGFRGEASHRIEPIVECPILEPALLEAARVLARAFGALKVNAVELSVTLLDDGIEAIVHGEGMLGYPALQGLADLAGQLDLARISYADGAQEPLPVAHRREGVMRFAGVPVLVPPFAFLQATAEGERVLREAVCGWLAPADRVADLFSGCGTFALPLAMARDSRRVVAIDRDGPAVGALTAAAGRPEVAGRLSCRTEDLNSYPLERRDLEGLDGVVFDPPRAGAKNQAEALAASDVPNIVAVSCNPATFARDASILLSGGYKLCAIAPLDQFLWTAHLEMAAHFQKA